MADTAFQIQYRQEFIAGFEQKQSLLRMTTTTETVIKGNQATFLVADSGGAEAVTRGVNGRIPARTDNLNQYTATLTEWHDLSQRTRFNVFASQGDGRKIMQDTTMGVINRKIDQDIITALNTGTVDTGAAATGSLNLVLKAKTILGNNEIPWDNNIFGLITPAMEAYLLQSVEYASSDYVAMMPIPGADGAWNDMPRVRSWLGVNWIVHPRLPGRGTSAEKCFMYHKSALGHAIDTEGMNTAVGYEEEQDYSYARATVFMGSKLLQNSGIVVINHDGSAYAAS